MTILEGMLPPPKARNEELERLIEVASQRIGMLSTEELARLGVHEYDDDMVVPAEGSAGRVLLFAAARSFVRWINAEGRFPQENELPEVATNWHREEATGSQVAQAYVDLGLFYSQHAAAATGAGLEDFRKILDAVAEQVVFTLLEDYGPLV